MVAFPKELLLNPAAAPPASPRRILVVDDDLLVLRSMTKALQRAGYSVHPATNVEEAMAVALDTRVDAAIVDYTLSYETGLTILSKLRQLQPHCVRILCTGRTELPVFVEAVNAGEVARVVRKPFQLDILLRQLGEALSSQEQLERYTTERHASFSQVEREALRQTLSGHIGMALQPIVTVNGAHQTPTYYEALMRPKNEILNSPMALLDAAERQQMIGEAASVVLQQALRSLQRIPTGLGLFVNLHPEQLGNPEGLMRDLKPYAGSADRITLEITERSRLQDIEHWDESVRIIGDLGFAIAVDDLGAGYSSLSILADLRPQFIKLDMSLVRGLHLEPRKQRLVHLMATFGAATEAQVIAEGVEVADEAAALTDCGITLMQGYHFGRPTEGLLALSGGKESPPEG
jgi:EAL domain-containing protein (putative c-di-GMP-specific phosphodiesterase class I)